MTKQQMLEKTAASELLRFLGAEIESVEDERVALSMLVTPRVHQYIGIMNGGVSLLLSETAASIGAVAASDLGKVTPVGIEINANHLRAVSKGKITVEATRIYPGKTLNVWSVEIRDERRRLICVSRCTILLRRAPAAPKAAAEGDE